MSTVSWNPSYPASSSTASEGDDAIRSFMTNVAIGLGEMVYFPGSAASQGASTASTGEVRLGTMRVVKQPTVTTGFQDGYLAAEATRMGLWHIGSTWSGLVGHPNMLDTGVVGVRTLMQTGQFNLPASSSGSTFTAFATAYDIPPVVLLTPYGTAGLDDVFIGAIPQASGFSSTWSCGDGLSSAATVDWLSYGTVTV